VQLKTFLLSSMSLPNASYRKSRQSW